MIDLPDDKGIYLLQLSVVHEETLGIGRLGTLWLSPGTCFYIGSARGPGGLRARIAHHLGSKATPHWHIDHLRGPCRITEIWFSTDGAADECLWAQAVASIGGTRIPLARFGASDCRCAAHLFWRRRPFAPSTFRRHLRRLGDSARGIRQTVPLRPGRA
ncbi:GIY-YIG nuclease family protein [Geothermobacter ehrlichii]|nr:GIY-YIG nuclease family protein [Geothermobacter ehrlichii]